MRQNLNYFFTYFKVSSNEIENINEVKSEELYVKNRHEMLVEKSLLQQPSAIKFGEWEKYTKVRKFYYVRNTKYYSQFCVNTDFLIFRILDQN